MDFTAGGGYKKDGEMGASGAEMHSPLVYGSDTPSDSEGPGA